VDIYMKLDLRTWEIKADGRRDQLVILFVR